MSCFENAVFTSVIVDNPGPSKRPPEGQLCRVLHCTQVQDHTVSALPIALAGELYWLGESL